MKDYRAISAGGVPVLCVPASAKGIHDATTLITAWETTGLPVSSVVVAVTGIAASTLPRRVLAGLTLLQPRVAGIVRIPHEPRLRALDTPRLDWAGRNLRHAIADLATALAAATTASTAPADSAAAPRLQPQAATPPSSPVSAGPASGVGGRAASPVAPAVSSSASYRSTGRTPC